MNDTHLIESPLTSELLYDGKIVHLYRDTVTLPNGSPALREVIRHVGAVCVVPLTDEGEVICVRQFRYPHGKVLLEIPAGKLDSKEEDRPSAALRELQEETGARCERLIPLGQLLTTPAFVDEVIDMYLAEGLTFGDTNPDEDEFLDVVKIPLDTLVKMVMNGEIKDSKTQTAILKTHFILQNEKNQ